MRNTNSNEKQSEPRIFQLWDEIVNGSEEENKNEERK
jgi:hypothetical protein